MAKTDQEMLSEVQDAIYRILKGGQDVTYDGRRVAYADLEKLEKLEERYQARIRRTERGGIRVRRGVPE